MRSTWRISTVWGREDEFWNLADRRVNPGIDHLERAGWLFANPSKFIGPCFVVKVSSLPPSVKKSPQNKGESQFTSDRQKKTLAQPCQGLYLLSWSVSRNYFRRSFRMNRRRWGWQNWLKNLTASQLRQNPPSLYRRQSTDCYRSGTADRHDQMSHRFPWAHPEPDPVRARISRLASGRYARENQYCSPAYRP